MINPCVDTIYALGSGLPPSGVAVLRISGPASRFAIEMICRKELTPRTAHHVQFHDPNSGAVIDDGIALFFPAPKSFTGEDVLELHGHGGRATVHALLACLSGLPDFRLAERGEFTRRAFANQKMDLVGVEGLSDLILAETEAQRRLARRQTSGLVSSVFEHWRTTLIRVRALVEAELDFPEEDDVPGSVSDRVWSEISALIIEMEKASAEAKTAERIRDGVQVVLVGRPNAGKSSLLNMLAGRDVAIVSDVAGTTRDIIDVHLDLGGVAVRLSDTAGLRLDPDHVERMGIERAISRAADADIVLSLEAADMPQDDQEKRMISESIGLQCGDHGTRGADERVISIGTKADLLDAQELNSIRGRYDFLISVVSGVGIDPLLNALTTRAAAMVGGSESLIVVRARHKEALAEVLEHLRDSLSEARPLEMRAEALRLASDRLARLTGRIDVEDLLDVVFRDFCIGK